MYEQITEKQDFINLQDKYVEACRRAKEFENAGEYELAAKALGDLWDGIGEKPELEDISNEVKAEILVRIGTLTGWLGNSRQIEGSQEQAKDLIGEGLRLYEESGDLENAADAQSELGICYWREGSFPEAQQFLQDALEKAPEDDHALRGKILLRLVNVAISTRKYQTALSLLEDAEKTIKKFGDNLLQGKLYFHQGLVNKLLFEEEENSKFALKATQKYQKAYDYYLLANHKRYCAIVENNLGFLFLSIEKYNEAHEHLENAIKLFTSFNDSGRIASVFDTKARVYLAEQKLIEAELFAQKSVQLFMGGDEYFSLSESLTTLGIVFARQESFANAKESFEKAIDTANYVNDSTNAGLAMLAQIEEMQTVLYEEEKTELYKKAEKLLSNSNRTSIQKRLKKAEEICNKNTSKSEWDDFSFYDEVLKFEAHYISKALKQTGGRVTRAAELLDLSHQNLSLLLKTRHSDLASIKKPRKRRSDRKRKSRKK